MAKFKEGDIVDLKLPGNNYTGGEVLEVDGSKCLVHFPQPIPTMWHEEADLVKSKDKSKITATPQNKKPSKSPSPKQPASKSNNFKLGDYVENSMGDVGKVVKVDVKGDKVLVDFEDGMDKMWVAQTSNRHIKYANSDNADKNSPLGNVVFGGRGNDPDLAKLQGAKPGSEMDTKKEKEIYSAIKDWVGNANNWSADRLKNEVPKLVKRYPKIFQPSTKDKTPLFRGLRDFASDTRKALLSTKMSDWVPFEKGSWWLCKKPIDYKPQRAAQSWTHDLRSAKNFGDFAILITRQKNGEFFMNTKVMKIFFGDDEKEVLHLGKTYANKVYVAVSNWEFKDEIEPKINKMPKSAGTFKSFAKTMKERNNKN